MRDAVGFGNIGEVETRMNVIRDELNTKGWNMGQRMSYEARSFDRTLSPSYIPFDDYSKIELDSGRIPSTASKHIRRR